MNPRRFDHLTCGPSGDQRRVAKKFNVAANGSHCSVKRFNLGRQPIKVTASPFPWVGRVIVHHHTGDNFQRVLYDYLPRVWSIAAQNWGGFHVEMGVMVKGTLPDPIRGNSDAHPTGSFNGGYPTFLSVGISNYHSFHGGFIFVVVNLELILVEPAQFVEIFGGPQVK